MGLRLTRLTIGQNNMRDLFLMVLGGSVFGVLFCWLRWDKVTRYSELQEPEKTQIFMLVVSTIGLIFSLLVILLARGVPL